MTKAAGITIDMDGWGQAVFTTRAEGNLSLVKGPGREQAADVRRRLTEQLGLGQLRAGRQVHGSTVQRIDAPPAADVPIAEADGQATALGGLGVMVLTADCLPVALASETAVAVVHAGWRGLAGGVLEQGVRAVRELGGTEAVIAVIGPGAGPCCYEVGPEVHAALGLSSSGPATIDLRAVARSRLTAAGVGGVQELELCTICDRRFFSHRREGELAGRQAGIAWRT